MLRFIALGTGSTFPNERRNHPAFYFEYKGTGFLLDCGEGTQRQFRIAKISPTKVDYVFITHWHGDHCLGLPGVLFNLANSEYSKKLTIIVPEGNKKRILSLIEDFQIPLDFPMEILEISKSGKILDFKEFEIWVYELKHSTRTYCFIFKQKDYWKFDKNLLKRYGLYGKHKLLEKLRERGSVNFKGREVSIEEVAYVKKGFKFSYVTDTTFFKELPEYVKNSDVLLIESTYINDVEKAREHYHLDFSEALEIFKKSESNIMLVTHVSQRYEEVWDEVVNLIESHPNCYLLSDFDRFSYERNKIYLSIRGKQITYERDERTGLVTTLK